MFFGQIRTFGGQRGLRLIAAIAIGSVAVTGCGSKTPPRAAVVDVLLITIDTLRADALGAYGNRTAATPWIDRLAAGGVRFDAAHAQTVVTLPSHANILSGRYPFAHGVRDNAGFRFPQTVDTLATILKSRGYRTGAFVSAFPLDSRFGLARGFDEYDDRLSDRARPAFLEQERAGTDTVEHARAWLAREPGRPTFCWVHLYEPHFPYAPPEPFASTFRDNPYEGEVAAADAAAGMLLKTVLDAADRRTLVILTGDHGESLGDHGEATHGIFAYESTLRVPLILYAPGALNPGVRKEARHIDILPTALHLLSIPAPAGIDGIDLLAPRDAATSHPEYFEALSGVLNRGWAPLHGVVDRGLKYIDLPVPELYDLAADPSEQHNLALARDRTADVARLKSILATFPDRVPRPAAQDDTTSERLRSLGYVSGGGARREHFTEADDPKRLIGIDRELQRIVTLYLDGQGPAALTAARTLASAHPSMPIAWLELAHLEREGGDLARAIDALTRAHTLNPSNTETAALLGGYLTQAGRPQDAAALLTPYAAAPNADLEVLTTLALARARQGAIDDALGLVRRARDQDPNSGRLFVDEGTVLLMGGRRDAARTAFEQALQRDPGSARAESSLGAIAIEEGRMDEAVTHWRAAVARDPGEYGPIFALGVAFARAGRNAQARTCFQFFADAAPPTRYGQQIAQARAWLAQR